jgi:hypothetical protein
MDNQDGVPRPVHFADFLVALSGFVYNIAGSVQTLAEEVMELAIYNANRHAKVNKVWEQFTNDLETIEEEQQ